MDKPLPIGIDIFKRIIDDNYCYVDKTGLIKELIDNGSYAVLIPRPRRFGKTLNLSMLKSFFEKSDADNSYLFKDLLIDKAGEIYKKHQGRYPVINLSFKDADFSSFDYTINKIKSIIGNEFSRHKYLLEGKLLDETEIKRYKSIIDKTAEYVDYFDTLKDLSGYLEAYHNEKVLILIDEYDVPVNAGYMGDYYANVVEFMRPFLSAALKTNEHLWKAVITGCMRIAKESIFTGLNNLQVLSIFNNKYSEYFGFTQSEVEKLAKHYGIENRLLEIKAWYDGYLFGNNEVYNPWSIINYINEKPDIPVNYWANTSGNDLVKRMIAKGDSNLKRDLQVLLEGGKIEKIVTDNIVYHDIDKNNNYVWNFLLFGGYLRLGEMRKGGSRRVYRLTIPNEEVKDIYQGIILDWTNEGIRAAQYDQMIDALLNGDHVVFSGILNEYLVNSLSYFDSEESFYHGFVLGMLINLSGDYILKSNKESGYGRYDIMLIPKDAKASQKAGIIIEFKLAGKYINETMEEAAQKALEQIEEKQYERELLSAGCLKIFKYGISFKNKKACVLMHVQVNG